MQNHTIIKTALKEIIINSNKEEAAKKILLDINSSYFILEDIMVTF